MADYTIYHHYGVPVGVRTDLKGKHRQHCLCYSCHLWDSCEIRKEVHALCEKENLVLPVWECPSFMLKDFKAPQMIRTLKSNRLISALGVYEVLYVDGNTIFFKDNNGRLCYVTEDEEGELWESADVQDLGKVRLLESCEIAPEGTEFDIARIVFSGNVYIDNGYCLEEAEEGEQWERV